MAGEKGKWGLKSRSHRQSSYTSGSGATRLTLIIINSAGRPCHVQCRAFSIAELLASMTILLLLVTVTITWYGGTAEEARVSMAKVEARKIAGMIEARQLTSRENYQSTQLPGSYAGNGQDPWGHGWTIDPAHAAVLSPGPDGLLDGGVDDISASWEPFTRRAAPITTGTTGSGAGSSGEDSTQGRKDAEAQRKD